MIAQDIALGNTKMILSPEGAERMAEIKNSLDLALMRGSVSTIVHGNLATVAD